MLALPTPPVSVLPAHEKPVKPSASVMEFPQAPLDVAVTVTTLVADDPVTLTLAPFRTIAAARLVAVAVVLPVTTRKFVPVLSVVLAVRTRVPPILTVWPFAGFPVTVPVRLAATVAAAPVRLVLKATKSFAQLGVAVISNVNLAGNIPGPTRPPATIDMAQSPSGLAAGSSGPVSSNAPVFGILLHPALTSSQQGRATLSKFRAALSSL